MIALLVPRREIGDGFCVCNTRQKRVRGERTAYPGAAARKDERECRDEGRGEPGSRCECQRRLKQWWVEGTGKEDKCVSLTTLNPAMIGPCALFIYSVLCCLLCSLVHKYPPPCILSPGVNCKGGTTHNAHLSAVGPGEQRWRGISELFIIIIFLSLGLTDPSINFKLRRHSLVGSPLSGATAS